MVNHKHGFFLVLLVFLISVLVQSNVMCITAIGSPYTARCELYGNITRIVDGDTVRVFVLAVFDKSISLPRGVVIPIRLADINAPELNTPEGVESRNQLVALVDRYGVEACLDVDNLRVYDPYNRVIAVMYLRLNETHWLNVNKWMLENKYAFMMDFKDNEFDPRTWSLYVNMHVDLSNVNSDQDKGVSPLLLTNPLIFLFSVVLVVLFMVLLIRMFRQPSRDILVTSSITQ